MNKKTEKSLNNEIKCLEAQCKSTVCNKNKDQEEPSTSKHDVNKKIHNHVRDVITDTNESKSQVLDDQNLHITEFLNEIQEKTLQMEELISFIKGSIRDVDMKIQRLNDQIKRAEELKEAAKMPRREKNKITAEALNRAKEKFNLMKEALHELIMSMFPDIGESIKDVLEILLTEKLNNPSSGYVGITLENHDVVMLLVELKIAVINPNNDKEVKLPYNTLELL